MRLACSLGSSGSRFSPRASEAANKLAAATASCTARLMPTPPMGDIACAASPITSKPGRHHSSSRSTVTVSSFTSSQLWIAWSTPVVSGPTSRTRVLNASIPSLRKRSAPPLGKTNAHCQYSPRSISTKMRPVSNTPMLSFSGRACLGKRNQNTSIGAPMTRNGNPARKRESRPSLAITSRARTSSPTLVRTPTTRPSSSIRLSPAHDWRSSKLG